jgi:hypothetical protein
VVEETICVKLGTGLLKKPAQNYRSTVFNLGSLSFYYIDILLDVMIPFNDANTNNWRDFYFLPDVMISFNDAYAKT